MGTDHDVLIAVEDAELRAARRTRNPTRCRPSPRPSSTSSVIGTTVSRPSGSFGAVGWQVLAVAQHDDQETRTLALDAGALRVFSYNKFFQDGPALVTRFLLQPPPEQSSLEEGS